jgi:chorismate mutase
LSQKVRGIRGAITVAEDREEIILEATLLLMDDIIRENKLVAEDVASVFITCTEDLVSTFPAKVLRRIAGWELVPIICSTEIPVPGSLPQCIRVLLHVNTELAQNEVKHVYLRDAEKLRPDLHLTHKDS